MHHAAIPYFRNSYRHIEFNNKTLNALIARRRLTSIIPLPDLIKEHEYFEEYMDDDKYPRVIPKKEEPVNSSDRFLNQLPTYAS